MPKLHILLDVDGAANDALNVVDTLLDNGLLQDAINDHECDDAGPLHVRSALVDFSHHFLENLSDDDVLVLAQALDDHLFNTRGWLESTRIIEARQAHIAKLARMLGRAAKREGFTFAGRELPFKRCCKCGAFLTHVYLPGQDERCDDCKDPG